MTRESIENYKSKTKVNVAMLTLCLGPVVFIEEASEKQDGWRGTSERFICLHSNRKRTPWLNVSQHMYASILPFLHTRWAAGKKCYCCMVYNPKFELKSLNLFQFITA